MQKSLTASRLWRKTKMTQKRQMITGPWLDKKRKDNPEHKENCDCRVFTSPCMSFTKIGLAMSLEFDEPDGTKLNLDVDVSPHDPF